MKRQDIEAVALITYFMNVPDIDALLVILRRYKSLGDLLMPKLEENEIVPGTRVSVRKNLDLLTREIAVYEKAKGLLEGDPNNPLHFSDPTPTPEVHRKLVAAEIKLYERYKELGMSEEDAIKYSLDPRSATFRKFDDLAVIYGLTL